MFSRFFTIISCTLLAFNAHAITADDISIKIEPFYAQAQKTGKIVNNYILNLGLPEGWYTYYKNGGDAARGAIIKVDNLPENTELSELYHSIPVKHEDKGFTSYIYNDNAIFNFQILNNSESLNADNLKLNGELDFLVCKDICIPMAKNFSIESTIAEKAMPNIEYFKYSNLFPPKEISEFVVKDNHLYIKLSSNDKLNTASFIPDMEGLINDGAKQELINKAGFNFLKVEIDDFLKEVPSEISGIITTNEKTYNITANKIKLDLATTQEKLLELALIALLALLGGIILNLMPCVLPVIGLKVFALLKHTSLKERLKGAASYTAGVFVSMMVIVALLLMLKALGNDLAWGFQLQNKYFVGFMIGLLMLIGLNLLGIFEVGDNISSKASALNMKYSNDFFTGVLTTLVATPCTAPFMATSLGFALSSDSSIATFIIFTFLALGIALPILIIAALPKAHKFLPKPGGWSEKLKQFLAFPIFATVVWLVWVLDSGNYIITLCLSGVFIASFIGWSLTLKSKIKYLIIMAIITLSSVAIYNHHKKPEAALEFNIETINNLNNEGKNVFVDFTAKWCLTCQYNKKSVLDLTETRALFRQYNTEFMIADWTLRDDKITKELEKFGRSGVPAYIVYPAYGRPIVLPEILTKSIIEENLRKI